MLFAYKGYLRIKAKTWPALMPLRRRSAIIFSNRYLVHVIVIVIAVFVATSNIRAGELNTEEFGRRSVIASLVRSELEEEITEELAHDLRPQVLAYLSEDEGVAFASDPMIGVGGIETADFAVSSLSGDATLIKPNIALTTKNIKLRDGAIAHTVQEGETAGTIAEHYGISVNTILWANNLGTKSLIKPGQELRILAASGVEHKVAKNETISKIAGLYGVDETDIADQNDLDEDEGLKIGQVLMIPGAKRLTPASPAKPVTRLTAVRNFFAPPSTTTSYEPSSKMLWPTTARRISQYSHYGHIAIDIDGSCGDPAWAPESGVVTKVAYLNWGYGNHIIIDHGGGVQTLMAHFSSILVQPGQHVKRGEFIAYEGTTGMSTGCHIHFEYRVNGGRVNPLPYLQ